jgi:hypothetical protein
VLSARDLCTPGDAPTDALDVEADTVLRDLLPALARADALRVLADGAVIGTLSRQAALEALRGAPLDLPDGERSTA